MRRMMAVAVVAAVLAPAWAGRAAAQETRPAQGPAEAIVPATSVAPATPLATEGRNATARLRPSAAGAELLVPAQAPAAEQRQMVHAPAYRHAPGLALMIVGGALFLGGAIISGDPGTALMVGGVVVGAVGLYQYLQ